MKTFLFTMIACIVPMCEVCHGDPSALASEQSPSESSKAAAGKNDDRRLSAGNSGQASAQSASNLQKRPEETAASRNSPGNIFGDTMNSHVSARPGSVAVSGLPKVNGNHLVSARPAGVVSPGGPSFNNARNRSPGLATIGGPAEPAKGTAAIAGTTVAHKH